MGLAAAKVGWKINSNEGLNIVQQLTQHLDASYQENSHLFAPTKRTAWDNIKRRLDYHYRLNRARLEALKDFDFYFR